MYDDLPKLFIAATPFLRGVCSFIHNKALWVLLGGRLWVKLAVGFVGLAGLALLALLVAACVGAEILLYTNVHKAQKEAV